MVADWMEVDWLSGKMIFFFLIIWYFVLKNWENNGTLDRWNATRIFGIALMLRTKHGQKTLEKMAKPRAFWRAYGEVSLWICILLMFFVLLLLLLSFVLSILDPPTADPPSAAELVAIPGLNPVIPLGWGIIAFVVALVIHEFGHGLQARAHGMRVRSFGMLTLGPLPLGAFAEPEGEELMKAPNRERMRLFAAGPATNIFACLFCFLIIAGMAGQFVAADPGLHASAIVEGSGADDAGLTAFDVIISINQSTVADLDDFSLAMDGLSAGDSTEMIIVKHDSGETETISVQLTDKHQHYLDNGASEEWLEAMGIKPGDAFVGVIGLASGTAGIDRIAGPLAPGVEASWGAKALATPIQIMTTIAIPVDNMGTAINPVEEGMLAAGEGWLASILGVEGMLFIVHLMFWLVWVNLLLGFFNLIPMLPFDGGHIFRDAIRGIIKRFDRFGRRFGWWKIHPLKLEQVTNKTSSRSSLVMLIIIVFIMVIPYI